MVPYILPVAQISLTGSVYTILVIAVERLYCVIRYLFILFLRLRIWLHLINRYDYQVSQNLVGGVGSALIWKISSNNLIFFHTLFILCLTFNLGHIVSLHTKYPS